MSVPRRGSSARGARRARGSPGAPSARGSPRRRGAPGSSRGARGCRGPGPRAPGSCGCLALLAPGSRSSPSRLPRGRRAPSSGAGRVRRPAAPGIPGSAAGLRRRGGWPSAAGGLGRPRPAATRAPVSPAEGRSSAGRLGAAVAGLEFSGFFDFSLAARLGSRSRDIRKKPMITVTPVVTAITGKPSISGWPTLSSVPKVSPPAGMPAASRMTPGTVTACTIGGWTIGPNSPRRCTAHTARTAPPQ